MRPRLDPLPPGAYVMAALAVACMIFAYARIARPGDIGYTVGIEPAYCEQMLARVRAVAPGQLCAPVNVVVEDTVVCQGYPVLGLYEQDIRRITIRRDALHPWLLAHEFAHAIYCDTHDRHPEEWANLTADRVAGHRPVWVGGAGEQ